MSFEEYLAWEAEQEEKWKLVDGWPVLRSERWSRDPVTGMAGTAIAHNIIVANLITSLTSRLRGGPCWAVPSHLKHRSSHKTARYPDASVDCGPDSLLASEPRVIFEVLSASNTVRGQMLLADYQAIPSAAHIVFVEQDRPSAVLRTRNPDGWRAEGVEGLDAVLPLTGIGLDLPVAEIYERLSPSFARDE